MSTHEHWCRLGPRRRRLAGRLHRPALAGFSHHVALLTAAHFVHAGFGVSMLLWLGGHRRALWVHQLGMAAVAAGIAEWPVLQPVGAVCIVAALATWSIGNVGRIRHRQVQGWRSATLAGGQRTRRRATRPGGPGLRRVVRLDTREGVSS